jgi:hypothetical protein
VGAIVLVRGADGAGGVLAVGVVVVVVVLVVVLDVEEEEDEEVEGSAIELFALCRLFVSMAMLLCVGTTVVSALRLERLAFLDFLRVNLKPPASSPVVNATLGFTIMESSYRPFFNSSRVQVFGLRPPELS